MFFQKSFSAALKPFSRTRPCPPRFFSNLFSSSDFDSSIINIPIDRQSERFIQNKKEMSALCEKLTTKLKQVELGGGPELIEKHKKKNKMLARERIENLLDEGSPFLEFSPLAGDELYENENLPSGGIVTGIGYICHKLAVIVANDATVKAGTYYPITIQKHLRAQEIAEENGLPCVYLVDSGGANLPNQIDVFPGKNHFGRIFFNQANMSKKGISQISVVFGSCTAGGAYVPAMSDENIMIKNNSSIFLAGPPLVKAATAEVISAEDLGGADVHNRLSGVADHYAENEMHAIQMVREIFNTLPHPKTLLSIGAKKEKKATDLVDEPLESADDLLGLAPINLRQAFEVRTIIARLVDGSRFFEFKPLYGKTLVTGFATLHNQQVAILANNGVLHGEAAIKGAHFIQLANQRHIPLLFLQNITGFMVGSQAEHNGIAKHGAKLVNAVATSTVPKLTLLIGASYGAGNYGMCGRAYSPRMLFSWPNAKLAVMGGEQAANVMKQLNPKNDFEELKKKFDRESDAFFCSSRLLDDGIIHPLHTRQVLSYALNIAMSNYSPSNPSYGVFRM